MAKREKSTFERLNGKNLNRNQRRALQQKIFSEDPGLEILHPDAAGIDIGNESHFVSVPPERDPTPVQEFGSWTADNALSNSCAIGAYGRMAQVVWRKGRGDAVHSSVGARVESALLVFGTQSSGDARIRGVCGEYPRHQEPAGDRKSTRLNSSHSS